MIEANLSPDALAAVRSFQAFKHDGLPVRAAGVDVARARGSPPPVRALHRLLSGSRRAQPGWRSQATMQTLARPRYAVPVRLPPGGIVSYTRITVRPDQMGGAPCIRGLRIPVATVVGMVADGASDEEILHAYPDLEVEDIREALRYAADAVREREIPVVSGG